MAKTSQLVILTSEQLRELPGFKTQKPFEVKFAKRAVAAADAKGSLKNWMESVRAPKVEQPAPKKISAVRLTTSHVTRLRAVNESTAPTAEAINQQMDLDELLGVTYSAFVTYHYWKLAANRKKQPAGARNNAAVNDEWKQVVDGAIDAFAQAGVKGLTEDDLDKMAAELGRNKSNFNAVATIANSAQAAPATASKKLGHGNFVTQTAVLPSPLIAVAAPANVCSQPFAQGSYTKHFGQSFSLKVSFHAPCFPKVWKTCSYTLTIASLSYNVDLNVGYKITCCGASAWGQAGARVCGSILGHTACASCTAAVTGVTGLTKNQVGSNCIYGLGVVAELKCKVGSITVLHVSAPFGWTITGPCPPPGVIIC